MLSQVDEKGNKRARLRCKDQFFKSGMVAPYISERGLGCCFLPVGHIHSNSCRGFFESSLPVPVMVAYLNSSLIDILIYALTPDRKHEPGIIGRLPSPIQAVLTNADKLSQLAYEGWAVMVGLRSADETDPLFAFYPQHVRVEQQQFAEKLRCTQATIDRMVESYIGLSEEESTQLSEQSGAPHDYGTWSGITAVEEGVGTDGEEGWNAGYYRCLASYCVGILFGRWDIRKGLRETEQQEIRQPLDKLPAFPPGALLDSAGRLATAQPAKYPLIVDWDGILVDDSYHEDDIVRRVREVLEVVWKERSEIIEKEGSEVLGVKELRDYFRKPGKGGFWDDHVARYSKSRRKAPIYWLLQSSKKNYALWLYYHRLDKDLLFKALHLYVEPKIQRETNGLDEMRRQKQAAGESGRGPKKLDKDIERQEDLISELRDFEDKLRRAANLHLEPDLNDGVVLNIAPLHELVPWKEAKKYWEELLEGKYEWSSIGKQLREKGW